MPLISLKRSVQLGNQKSEIFHDRSDKIKMSHDRSKYLDPSRVNINQFYVKKSETKGHEKPHSVTLVLLFQLRPRRSIWRLGTSIHEKLASLAFREC